MSASEAMFTFKIQGQDLETRVLGFNATEEVSRPFSVNLHLAVPDTTPVAIADVVNHAAGLTIESGTQADAYRHFHGIIQQFSRTGHDGDYHLYKARLTPAIDLLDLERDYRIFQDKSVSEIITAILDGQNSRLIHHRFALNREPSKRTYCVQYRESTLNFIHRLLEEEGIFYFFEHEKDRHVVVFADHPSHCAVIKGKPEVAMVAPSGLNAEQETITSGFMAERVRPGTFTHGSRNYERMEQTLEANRRQQQFEDINVYEYSGRYADQGEGDALAEIRLAEHKLMRQGGGGTGNCPRLTAGHRFTLASDTDDLGKQEHLLICIEHGGTQPQVLEEGADGPCSYENSFTCLPVTAGFRPGRTTPKPVIPGLHSALVTGPAGEQIHTDDLGRVKVQFLWDRQGQNDDKTTCWIRVAQAWAGLARGYQFIPRVGDEVLVDFLEGDPDRPIVVGSVYNSTQPPLLPAADKTKSGLRTKTYKGEGFHELCFDDAKEKEKIYLRSERDWEILIKNDKGQTIGGDSTTDVTGKLTETAEEIILKAKKKITIEVGGNRILIDKSGIRVLGGKVKVNP